MTTEGCSLREVTRGEGTTMNRGGPDYARGYLVKSDRTKESNVYEYNSLRKKGRQALSGQTQMETAYMKARRGSS